MSIPPQDIDAEQAVLGAMLVSKTAIDRVVEVLDARDFYRPSHETIHDAIVALHAKRKPVDMVTVAAELQRRGELNRVGGAAYLHTCSAMVPAPASVAYYAEIVHDKAILRRLVDVGHGIQARAEADDAEVDTVVADCRKSFDDALASNITKDAGMDAATLLEQTLESLERVQTPGLPTGWRDLDDFVSIRPGQLIVVGARPSTGKSVIAANLAAHACAGGVGVHFASLEMTRDELMKRILSARASVDLARMMDHTLNEGDWERVAAIANEVMSWPLWVDETESQSLAMLRNRVRTTAQRKPLGLVIVDYLQLMAPRDRRVPREQQVGELSEGLKSLAKEMSVPVVALAQLNRASEQRHDKRPTMADLRESGRIEADADQVWLLHREDLVDPESTTGELELMVAKQRNGQAGRMVRLQFQGHYSRAVNAAFSPSAGWAK